MSQVIHTDQAPAAIGPYSQAVRSGNTVYFSGQIPLDPATGALVEGDIEVQARRAFDAVLEAPVPPALIAAILNALPGWQAGKYPQRCGPYGVQRIWRKISE